MKTPPVTQAATLGMLLALAGCSNMKNLEKDVAALKTEMARLQTDVQSAHTAAEAAAGAAQSANQVANGAQSSANQALAATQSSQACCAALDQKVDRIFERTVTK